MARAGVRVCVIMWNNESRVRGVTGGAGSRGESVLKPKGDSCTSTNPHTWSVPLDSPFNLVWPLWHRAWPGNNLLAQQWGENDT